METNVVAPVTMAIENEVEAPIKDLLLSEMSPSIGIDSSAGIVSIVVVSTSVVVEVTVVKVLGAVASVFVAAAIVVAAVVVVVVVVVVVIGSSITPKVTLHSFEQSRVHPGLDRQP